MIWRGRAGSGYAPTAPADSRWNLLLLRQDAKGQVSVEGPLIKAKPKTKAEGTEWLVIKCHLGPFIPSWPLSNLTDGEATLPRAARNSFWLHGSAWQFPDYEQVETFVSRLVREEVLFRDPVVNAVLAGQPQKLSARTVRRHFLRATGLPPQALGQISRAKLPAALLTQVAAVLDVVYHAS